jgi:hypothetical protein
LPKNKDKNGRISTADFADDADNGGTDLPQIFRLEPKGFRGLRRNQERLVWKKKPFLIPP